jgi:hypothetical protein
VALRGALNLAVSEAAIALIGGEAAGILLAESLGESGSGDDDAPSREDTLEVDEAKRALAGKDTLTDLIPETETPLVRPRSPVPAAISRFIWERNAARNAGTNRCYICGQDVVRVQNQKGVSPPCNQGQIEHIDPVALGGTNCPSNLDIACRRCNLEKGAK